MYVVGLTGGIGSGKSEAAACFAALGVPVTDTDVIAHRLTAAGMPAVRQITATLGKDCLTLDGVLDRSALRRKAFANPTIRHALEDILHPLIRAAVAEELNRHCNASYQIVVVPLLFEAAAGYQGNVNNALVVDCSEPEQIRRAVARGGLSEAEVRAIMAAQIPRAERLARADDVILNDGSLQELAENVRLQHEKYIKTCVVRQSTS